ncbi:hypothetical protein HDU97_000707 [Phlyctochytrium planicorne]|nr:hypothetical protein HDU97_000707 [Phlyctochytrium planicorne]
MKIILLLFAFLVANASAVGIFGVCECICCRVPHGGSGACTESTAQIAGSFDIFENNTSLCNGAACFLRYPGPCPKPGQNAEPGVVKVRFNRTTSETPKSSSASSAKPTSHPTQTESAGKKRSGGTLSRIDEFGVVTFVGALIAMNLLFLIL